MTRQELAEQNRRELAPYLEASRRISKQGKLLDLIRKPPSERIQLLALLEYNGYTKGSKSLVQTVWNWNRSFERSQRDQSLISRVECLLFILGSADTEKTHALLVSLLHPSLHPFFRAEVVAALGLENRFYDQELVTQLIPTFDHAEDICSALMGLTYAVWHADLVSYRKSIEPYLDHGHHSVRMYAREAMDLLERRLAEEADSK